ncbi:hypothetical protein ALC56_13362 [Trachymyrmex septentrionalis]|uniref:Uncharacterized protein n=1 Tax=Trachymyrmex septentrionalis TaxID=34720 RepID=A0A195EX97_9HYME|nr:hypothetical protein ALC56_13362 [Trachymyrmex septentrionalis]
MCKVRHHGKLVTIFPKSTMFLRRRLSGRFNSLYDADYLIRFLSVQRGYYSCNHDYLKQLSLENGTGDGVVEPCPSQPWRFGVRKKKREKARRRKYYKERQERLRKERERKRRDRRKKQRDRSKERARKRRHRNMIRNGTICRRRSRTRSRKGKRTSRKRRTSRRRRTRSRRGRRGIPCGGRCARGKETGS